MATPEAGVNSTKFVQGGPFGCQGKVERFLSSKSGSKEICHSEGILWWPGNPSILVLVGISNVHMCLFLCTDVPNLVCGYPPAMDSAASTFPRSQPLLYWPSPLSFAGPLAGSAGSPQPPGIRPGTFPQHRARGSVGRGGALPIPLDRNPQSTQLLTLDGWRVFL